MTESAGYIEFSDLPEEATVACVRCQGPIKIAPLDGDDMTAEWVCGKCGGTATAEPVEAR